MVKVQGSFERLSPQRQVFVTEWAADFNATRAAKEAGYACPSVAGAKLLKTPEVKIALADMLGPMIAQGKLTVEALLQQLSNFLYMDPIDLFNEDGSVKSMHLIPEEVRQCITSFDVDEDWGYDPDTMEPVLNGRKIKVKTVSKEACLKLAMQYRKLLEPDKGGTTNVNVGVNIQGFWEKFDQRALSEPPPAVDDNLIIEQGKGHEGNGQVH